MQGSDGKVIIKPPAVAICAIFQASSYDALLVCLDELPNVMRETNIEYGETIVTLKNWYKYQVDSTATERQKTSRYKKRGEEKRKEEIRDPSLSPLNGNAVTTFKPTTEDRSHLPGSWNKPIITAADVFAKYKAENEPS